MQPRYYQSSNKMPLGGVLRVLAVGLAAALGLGLVYVYLVWYIPFVYFNFCFCVIFGGALGLVVAGQVRRGQLRSAGGAALLGLALGLAAEYLQWAIYLTLVGGVQPGGSNSPSTSFSPSLLLALLLQPGQVWAMARGINADGLWSVLGLTPSGFWLWLVWALEAVGIVGACTALAYAQAEKPYSEASGEWATEHPLPRLLAPLPDPEAARAALEAGRFDEVLQPHENPAGEGEFAQVRLHQVPADEACRYLSLDAVTKKLNAKGEPETRTKPLVEYLALSPAQYAALAERLGAPADPVALPAERG